MQKAFKIEIGLGQWFSRGRLRLLLLRKYLLVLFFIVGVLLIVWHSSSSHMSQHHQHHHHRHHHYKDHIDKDKTRQNENYVLKKNLGSLNEYVVDDTHRIIDKLHEKQKFDSLKSTEKLENSKEVKNTANNPNQELEIKMFQQRNEIINNRIDSLYQDNNFDPNYNKNLLKTLDKLERLVHIDLKGAPPKINFFKEFIPLIKNHGATGILLEYEDMFPFSGILEPVKHGNAYSIEDIKLIKNLAKENSLKIMPLVQTYGHMEWILKHEKFAHLREDPNYPQVITPCLEESYKVIFEMIDQVVELHNDVPYFHIGCDEVYYKLVHKNCSSPTLLFDGSFSKAFMNHLLRVAAYVRQKLPKSKIIIWNDMLQNIENLVDYKPLIQKYEIEPMIWAYVEDVANWFTNSMYEIYGEIFQNAWAASAYKGASGELATITSIEHHYLNQISWNHVMHMKMSHNVCNFSGVAITGWSRYDHFLTLCDLLPEAIPSLIYCLEAAKLGEIDTNLRFEISNSLGCRSQIPWRIEDVFDGYFQCSFPGHEVYEAILPLKSIMQTLDENLEFAKKYMTPTSLTYNYAHSARAREVLERLEYSYSSLVRFKNNFIEACKYIYWNDTTAEWLDVYVIPHLNSLYDYMKSIKLTLKRKHWNPRPLKINHKEFPLYL